MVKACWTQQGIPNIEVDNMCVNWRRFLDKIIMNPLKFVTE